MSVVVVVVVVVDLDGDGDVEVDATFDATAAAFGRSSRRAQLPTPRCYQRAIEFLALVYDVVVPSREDMPIVQIS